MVAYSVRGSEGAATELLSSVRTFDTPSPLQSYVVYNNAIAIPSD